MTVTLVTFSIAVKTNLWASLQRIVQMRLAEVGKCGQYCFRAWVPHLINLEKAS